MSMEHLDFRSAIAHCCSPGLEGSPKRPPTVSRFGVRYFSSDAICQALEAFADHTVIGVLVGYVVAVVTDVSVVVGAGAGL